MGLGPRTNTQFKWFGNVPVLWTLGALLRTYNLEVVHARAMCVLEIGVGRVARSMVN